MGNYPFIILPFSFRFTLWRTEGSWAGGKQAQLIQENSKENRKGGLLNAETHLVPLGSIQNLTLGISLLYTETFSPGNRIGLRRTINI